VTVPRVVLVGERASSLSSRLQALLEKAGWSVQMGEPGTVPRLDRSDLVLVTGSGAVAWVETCRRTTPMVPVVVLSEQALEASTVLELGRVRAYDVIAVPERARLDDLLPRLEGAVAHGRQRRTPQSVGVQLIGGSARMAQVHRYLRQASRSTANVLVLGETGTGKELAARAIHEASSRRQGPFLAVNCAALTESLLESELFGHERGSFTGAERQRRGAFELAHGGTLFLDEVGETTPAFQAKLLRVLQPAPGQRETVRELVRVGGEAPVRTDVRVVAATNVELGAAVRSGRFRQDLFERLNVLTVQLPPLRDRPEDVPALVEHFLDRFAAEDGRERLRIDPAALQVLVSYRWPTNVRELESALRSIVTLKEGGDTIVLGDLPVKLFERRGPAPREAPTLRSLAEVEREHVARVLAATQGNKTRAARVLGVSRPRLDRLIVAHRLGGTRLQARAGGDLASPER
jgi:DNA-binding NtrC family response regulator